MGSSLGQVGLSQSVNVQNSQCSRLTSSKIGDSWYGKILVELLDLTGHSLFCDSREAIAQIKRRSKLEVVHTFNHVRSDGV